jgi:Glycosyltransferase 61
MRSLPKSLTLYQMDRRRRRFDAVSSSLIPTHQPTPTIPIALRIRPCFGSSCRANRLVLTGIVLLSVSMLCHLNRESMPQRYRQFHYDYVGSHPKCSVLVPKGTIYTHRIPIYRTSTLSLVRVGLVNGTSNTNNVLQPLSRRNATVMPTSPTVAAAAAICEFDSNVEHSGHFPHAMQQLYQCWSYWNGPEHVTKPRVLMIPKHAAGFDGERLSLADRAKRIRSNQVGSVFLREFLSALQEACNVTILRGYQGTSTTRYDFSASSVQRVANVGTIFRMQSINDARLLSKELNDHYKLLRVPEASTNQCGNASSYQQQHANTTQKDKPQLPMPRIAILNRELSSSRSIVNQDEIVRALQSNLTPFSPQHVTIATFEHTSFLNQVSFFLNHDIVISPHGAQLTLLPMLPQCGRILELFPANFYFDTFFGSLADVSSIDLYTLYLSDQDPALSNNKGTSRAERRRHRNVFLCPPVEDIVRAVQQIVQDWRVCCG